MIGPDEHAEEEWCCRKCAEFLALFIGIFESSDVLSPRREILLHLLHLLRKERLNGYSRMQGESIGLLLGVVLRPATYDDRPACLGNIMIYCFDTSWQHIRRYLVKSLE